MSDKIWVVRTPGGEFIEYDYPNGTYSDECSITAYVGEGLLIRAEARIKQLEEALENIAGSCECEVCEGECEDEYIKLCSERMARETLSALTEKP